MNLSKLHKKKTSTYLKEVVVCVWVKGKIIGDNSDP